MSAMSRREFFKKTAADTAIAGFLAAAAGSRAYANPLGLPIGSQTYPHRERIVKGDFAGLLKDMKALGIEVIELCNPAYKEFSSLADGKQTRKILDDNGMKCLSAHFTMDSLRKSQGQQIEWAQALGMTMMSTATLSARVTNGMTTLEEVKRAADEYNKIAAGAKKAGLQQILHNEGFENSRLEDGRLTYPVLVGAPRSGSREDAVPDVVDAHDRRPDHVFHEPSEPFRLGAPAGRGHDPGDGHVARRLPSGQANARGGRSGGGGRGQGPRRAWRRGRRR